MKDEDCVFLHEIDDGSSEYDSCSPDSLKNDADDAFELFLSGSTAFSSLEFKHKAVGNLQLDIYDV